MNIKETLRRIRRPKDWNLNERDEYMDKNDNEKVIDTAVVVVKEDE